MYKYGYIENMGTVLFATPSGFPEPDDDDDDDDDDDADDRDDDGHDNDDQQTVTRASTPKPF